MRANNHRGTSAHSGFVQVTIPSARCFWQDENILYLLGPDLHLKYLAPFFLKGNSSGTNGMQNSVSQTGKMLLDTMKPALYSNSPPNQC